MNSLLIALLIAVITLLFFIGSNVLGRAELGLRKAYIESLTGDVVIQAASDVTMNLFGANTPVIDSFFTIPPLPAYETLEALASAEAGVAGITSQVSGMAVLDLAGRREPALLCGVDAASYFSLFPGIVLDEGRFLRPGEYGAMISAGRAARIREAGGELVPGMPVLLTAAGEAGFRIREVPLAGIYHYQNPGPFMGEIVIVDPQTVRALNAIQAASAAADEGASGLLEGGLDELFGEAPAVVEDGLGDDETGFSTDALHAYLSAAASSGDLSGGDWHFIILRLEQGTGPGAFISALNKKLIPLGAKAVSWREAAGSSAILVLLLQALFNAGAVLVSTAGVIAIINLLLISVFRRTREIGSLRAMGAPDSYIRLLILGENCILALAAGAAGVALGLWCLHLINGMELALHNELIAALLGGGIVRITPLPRAVILSFAAAAALGIIASIYPIETAVRIEPMEALRRG